MVSSSSSSSLRSFLLFNFSGGLGTAIFYFLYDSMQSSIAASLAVPDSPLHAYSVYSASIAWTVSYLISILFQHALHRWLVFGSGAPYCSSLVLTYIAYSLGIVLSSVLSTLFTVYLLIPHRLSFVLTLAATGIINYFTVSNAMTEKSTKQQ